MTRCRRLAFAICAALALASCASRREPAPVIDRLPGKPAAAKPAPATAASPVASQPGSPAAGDVFYVVKRGDTLYSIALEHGADYRDVAQWNAIDDPGKLRVGQQLRIRAPEERVASSVQVGPARGAGRVEARPIDGSRTEPTKQAAAPVEPKPAPAPSASPAVPAAAVAVDFIWPAKGKILAGFAEPRSKGIDIDGKLGDPIVAAAAGRVTYIGNGIPGLGKLVVIKHDNGFITVYAHNREIVVKEQQAVTRGQKIAELGATDSDRPKLHFQIRKGAAAVDPLKYLPTT